MSNANDMSFQLFALATDIALESYGCDLDRLDPSCLAWYAERVTPENLEDLASDLAAAAWFEN
jgi:hypothetical protein